MLGTIQRILQRCLFGFVFLWICFWKKKNHNHGWWKWWADFQYLCTNLHPFFFQLKFEFNSTWTQLNLNWTSDKTLHKFVLHLYMKTSRVCVTSVHKNFMNKEISYRDLGRFRYTDRSTVHTTLVVQEHDGKKKRKTLNISSGHCHIWPTVQRFWSFRLVLL